MNNFPDRLRKYNPHDKYSAIEYSNWSAWDGACGKLEELLQKDVKIPVWLKCTVAPKEKGEYFIRHHKQQRRIGYYGGNQWEFVHNGKIISRPEEWEYMIEENYPYMTSSLGNWAKVGNNAPNANVFRVKLYDEYSYFLRKDIQQWDFAREKVYLENMDYYGIDIVEWLDESSSLPAAEPDKVYAFCYGDGPESAAATISIHRTKEGAEKAMNEHKRKEQQEYLRMHGDDTEFMEMCPFGQFADWFVMEVLISK